MSTANPGTITTAPLSPSVERRQVRLSMGVAAWVMLVGAAAALAARDLEYWTSLGPGPGFFPLWLGVLLFVFGGIWMAQLVRRQRRDNAPADPGAAESVAEPEGLAVDETPPEFSLPTVVAIVVSLCVLAAVLEVLGYQLSMFLFLMFHLLVLGRRRLLLSLVISLAGSFGVFVVFTRLLTVPLPASSIPFLQSLGL